MKVLLGSQDIWDRMKNGYIEPVDAVTKLGLSNNQKTTLK